METIEMKAKLEALLFITAEPLTISEMKRILESTEEPKEEVAVSADGGADVVSIEGELEQEAEQSEASEAVEVAPEAAAELDPLAQLKAAQQELNEEISKADIKNCLDELILLYQGSDHGFELVNVAKGYQFRTKHSMAAVVRKVYKLPKPRLSAPSMETLAIIAYQQPITRNKIEDIRGVDTGGVLKTLLEKDLVKIVGRSEEPGRPIMYGTSKAFLETFSLSSLSELPTLKDLDTLNATLSESSAKSDDEIIAEGDEESFAEELSFDNSLDVESNELLGDLDASLNSLKNLESEIFTETEEEKPTDEAQPS
ncbi:SMC-Scp complex subunit ScpB [bacterium]|nr:SMC-Scp complex subunit ScpB [bacterium]